MASHKRKREAFDDADEESPSYGKQILPVANLPDDFAGEPMDGMQYLFMVRRDARQRPDTVRVPNPYEKPEILMPEQSAIERPFARSSLPTEEWRDTFEYRLQNFRKNLSQPTIYVRTVNRSERQLIPDKKDRDRWWAFLSGRPELEWSPRGTKSKSTKQAQFDLNLAEANEKAVYKAPDDASNKLVDDEGGKEHLSSLGGANTLPSPAGTPTPLSLEYLESLSQPSHDGNAANDTSIPVPHEDQFPPREPTTELVKLIDEKYALHLLMYFAHWINTYVRAPDVSSHLPTESHARWIFALLSRIDVHVSADDMNLLRNLARSCIGLLKHIKQRESLPSHDEGSSPSNKMREASCWIIITTVVSIWKQRDLWMDAEDMIRNFGS